MVATEPMNMWECISNLGMLLFIGFFMWIMYKMEKR